MLLCVFREIVTIHLWIHKLKLHNLKSCKLMQSMQMRMKNSTRQKLWNAIFVSILIDSKSVQTIDLAHEKQQQQLYEFGALIRF